MLVVTVLRLNALGMPIWARIVGISMWFTIAAVALVADMPPLEALRCRVLVLMPVAGILPEKR